MQTKSIAVYLGPYLLEWEWLWMTVYDFKELALGNNRLLEQ